MLWELQESTTPWWPRSSPSWPATNPQTVSGESITLFFLSRPCRFWCSLPFFSIQSLSLWTRYLFCAGVDHWLLRSIDWKQGVKHGLFWRAGSWSSHDKRRINLFIVTVLQKIFFHVILSCWKSMNLSCVNLYFNRYLKALLWTLFCGVQVCVCLSRVFIAAHFPHQVIAGLITGEYFYSFSEQLAMLQSFSKIYSQKYSQLLSLQRYNK